jgi:hypothetical protein
MMALILAAAAAAASAQDDKPARLNNPDLNCKAGYEALLAQTKEQQGLAEAPSDSPSLIVYRSPNERAIYTITRKTHPAYPAIVRQKISGGPGSGEGGAVTIQTLSCAYGDHAASRKFVTSFFAEKNTQLKAEVESGHDPFQHP